MLYLFEQQSMQNIKELSTQRRAYAEETLVTH
jgi:hypothetical protein